MINILGRIKELKEIKGQFLDQVVWIFYFRISNFTKLPEDTDSSTGSATNDGKGEGARGWSSIMGTGGTMIVFGAISGGVSAELSGGNFWQGALIGGMVAGLNHVAHSTFNKLDSKESFSQPQKNPWDLNGDGKAVTLDARFKFC